MFSDLTGARVTYLLFKSALCLNNLIFMCTYITGITTGDLYTGIIKRDLCTGTTVAVDFINELN